MQIQRTALIEPLSPLFSYAKSDKSNDTKNTHKQSGLIMNDTTPKVTGIGGIFFYSDNPKETKEWYTKNLGIEINEWYFQYLYGF